LGLNLWCQELNQIFCSLHTTTTSSASMLATITPDDGAASLGTSGARFSHVHSSQECSWPPRRIPSWQNHFTASLTSTGVLGFTEQWNCSSKSCAMVRRRTKCSTKRRCDWSGVRSPPQVQLKNSANPFQETFFECELLWLKCQLPVTPQLCRLGNPKILCHISRTAGLPHQGDNEQCDQGSSLLCTDSSV
jgi:hypothetical protein